MISNVRWFFGCLLLALLILVAAAPLSAQETLPTVVLTENDAIGSFLVDSDGNTLYIFARDDAEQSNCGGRCLEFWPPLLVDEGEEPTAGDSILGELGIVEHAEGGLQVTYSGAPLYYFANDEAPGDTNGHFSGAIWFVARPATVMLGGNDELGDFLIGAGGRTLYILNRDAENVSVCESECARAWPPLLVNSDEEPLAGVGVPGQVGAIERSDGGRQVTYDGVPLYYFTRDAAPGDANGHSAADIWFAARPDGEHVPAE